jgi:hypothetical protein
MSTFAQISILSLSIILVLVLIESQIMVGQEQVKIWIKN